jgi:hypothetical protein
MEEYYRIKDLSNETFSYWKNVKGWAPESVVMILENTRLDWLKDLTESLEIWIEKAPNLTEGELLLACANLGALVEGWLKLFYCVYYEQYRKAPKKYQDKKMIEPNDLSFEYLKQFSRGILWELHSAEDNFVESIQLKRNAIHAFNDRYIGNSYEFLDDIKKFGEVIDLIDTRLPYE